MFSTYTIIELLALIGLTDNLLTIVFRGPKQFMKTYHIVEVLSTVALQVMGVLRNGFLTRENASDFEKAVPLFYTIYAGFCLIRLTRFIQLFFLNLIGIRFVIYGISDVGPFIKVPFTKLVILTIIFAQIGVEAFGGVINSGTPEEFARVSGDSDGNLYDRLNFNSFFNAVMYLWSLIINNCWPTLAIQAAVK